MWPELDWSVSNITCLYIFRNIYFVIYWTVFEYWVNIYLQTETFKSIPHGIMYTHRKADQWKLLRCVFAQPANIKTLHKTSVFYFLFDAFTLSILRITFYQIIFKLLFAFFFISDLNRNYTCSKIEWYNIYIYTIDCAQVLIFHNFNLCKAALFRYIFRELFLKVSQIDGGLKNN